MWNQQPPAWGWPPNMGYQYHDQQDTSQSWAAAAALWAQQRQIQEQYQNGAAPTPPAEKPPEPPGPPPQMPPLPPQDSSQSSSSGAVETSAATAPVEVHDYNHGHATEVVDYQHGNPTVNANPPDIIDYNHGQSENAPAVPEQQTWEYNNEAAWHQNYPPPDGYYNQEWNQEQWNQQQWTQENWNAEQTNYYQEVQYEQQPEINESNKGRNKHKQTMQPSGFHSQVIKEDYRGSGPNSPDITEIAKKSKSLPLWLRQGLEKLEKDKQKEHDKEKEKEDIPNAKLISGYQMANSPSPSPSPERESEDSGEEEEQIENEKQKPIRRKSRFDETPIEENKSTLKSSVNNDDEEEEGEEDDEEKQRQLILKIKTWMTEILLSVTNNQLKDVCKEVYFEMKRSARTKGQQLRRSGGLDALRSSLGGDVSSSEDEEEEEEKKEELKRPLRQTFKKPDLPVKPKEPSPTLSPPNTVKRQDTNSRVQQLLNDKSIDLRVSPSKKFLKEKERTANTATKPSLQQETDLYSREEELKRRLLEVEKLRKKRNRDASASENESDEKSSESYSESSESDNSKRKKKSKKRSRSRSPSRKSRKKSKRNDRDDSSSSENERRRKKKKKNRERSPSDEDSDYSYRKKKSKGKKHKHKDRSVSRSPPRHKRKR